MQNSATFKLIKKLKDDRFDEESIHDYTLLLNVGVRDLQVGVINSPDSRFLCLEDYVLPGVQSNDDMVNTLETVFDQHPFLKAGFWKQIKIAVKNQKLVQIPEPLFDPESSPNYLKFNAHVQTQTDTVLSVPMKNSQAVTTFAINSDLVQWFENMYPNKQFTIAHQSAALIEGTMEYSKSKNENPLYLYIDRFKLHIIYVSDNQLVYYNQFSIQNFQDYIKYIMLVMKTLGMNQQTSQVVMWGYLGKNSPHYHEFYKYIQNVSFGERPKNLTFSYVFDEIQEHHYFDLLSINLLD